MELVNFLVVLGVCIATAVVMFRVVKKLNALVRPPGAVRDPARRRRARLWTTFGLAFWSIVVVLALLQLFAAAAILVGLLVFLNFVSIGRRWRAATVRRRQNAR